MIPDYSDMVIATKPDDLPYRTTDGWAIYSCFTMLFLSSIGIVIGAGILIGIFLQFMGLIITASIIGLMFWLCKHYGTNHSVFDRWRYRTTKSQREHIVHRLSAQTIRRRLT